MTIDEGYIKYRSHWSAGPAPSIEAARQLDNSRHLLFAAGLIGCYPDLGIGFGNISIRFGAPGQFLISGTQTGSLERTNEEHYALVTSYDIARNEVFCTGPVQASSEALTHAAIYELNVDIAAVVHVHSKPLWDKHLDRLPTTRSEIAYGTPGMAFEFRRLYETSTFRSDGLAVMGGHEEGLISIGGSLQQATAKVLALLD
ncbi:MAG TPA: class II aldolase/adducin family protein [Woeseiaceae bacterium]|nr:class II aldolase/adducin family protein [Woeseiaceae bacterium]